jgi:hypothetical protein
MADPLILTPVDTNWVQWSHIECLRIPFIDELISHEPGHMVFNGYFYIDDAAMPIERVFHSNKGEFHVEIYEKKTLKDTSEFGPYDEEEGGHICFFPTAVIELRYHIISEIKGRNYHEAWKRIIQLETGVKEREERICEEKRQRDREEWERESKERKEKEEQKNN